MTTACSSARVATHFAAAAQSSAAGHRRQGEVQVQLIYKPYEDDEEEDEAEPEPYELLVEEQNITDIKSAAGPRPDLAYPDSDAQCLYMAEATS